MQEMFHSKIHFTIKITPLGANLCLMEENEDDKLKALVDSAPEWICEWFSEIRPWKSDDVDNDKMTWLRVFGVPCHAWCPNC